jgi:hypothetical protein
MSGIELALRRIGQRMAGKFALHEAMPSLLENYHPLHSDFTAFFPHLTRAVVEFDAEAGGCLRPL